jgi:phosphocarrier protein FPr
MKPVVVLTEKTVRLACRASDKAGAIRQAGELLVRAGLVAPSYVEGMLAREAVASTFLGNGIALPHGRFVDWTSILRPGLSVAQFPAGVAWNAEETAYLVIALAAAGGEHLEVLTNLTRVLEDLTLAAELAKTSSVGVVLERLNGSLASRLPAGDARS